MSLKIIIQVNHTTKKAVSKHLGWEDEDSMGPNVACGADFSYWQVFGLSQAAKAKAKYPNVSPCPKCVEAVKAGLAGL